MPRGLAVTRALLLDQPIVSELGELVRLVVEVEADVAVELEIPTDELERQFNVASPRTAGVAGHLDDRRWRVHGTAEADLTATRQRDRRLGVVGALG